jgi:ribose 5-phosphate isomerase A
MSDLKQAAAEAAIAYVEDNSVVGVGTGSTVNFFIEALAKIKHRIDACVASSQATEALLRAAGLPIIDLNSVSELPLYVDGADEVTAAGLMIKGKGGALTREKIIASVAKKMICIVDESKVVGHLGHFPVAVEVLPIARSYVARQLLVLGGDPDYREGFVTDNGNIILDVYNFTINTPMSLEDKINQIPGVVENGLFANRSADVVLAAYPTGVKKLEV